MSKPPVAGRLTIAGRGSIRMSADMAEAMGHYEEGDRRFREAA